MFRLNSCQHGILVELREWELRLDNGVARGEQFHRCNAARIADHTRIGRRECRFHVARYCRHVVVVGLLVDIACVIEEDAVHANAGTRIRGPVRVLVDLLLDGREWLVCIMDLDVSNGEDIWIAVEFSERYDVVGVRVRVWARAGVRVHDDFPVD